MYRYSNHTYIQVVQYRHTALPPKPTYQKCMINGHPLHDEDENDGVVVESDLITMPVLYTGKYLYRYCFLPCHADVPSGDMENDQADFIIERLGYWVILVLFDQRPFIPLSPFIHTPCPSAPYHTPYTYPLPLPRLHTTLSSRQRTEQ